MINDTAFIGNASNKYVKKFEQDYANFLNIKHCIAVGNGTDAIEIALKALNIGEGDEVIVPALSWIATSEAVSNIEATPIFIDIDESFNIDVNLIETKITSKTRAIIVVHLYGHPADMDKIVRIAKKKNLKIIEDCAQSHNAEFNGQKIGTFGNVSTFSFFPSKNLGAMGDAGGIVTADDDIANKCRLISQHGQSKIKHKHFIEGRNSRMDGIQASVLSVKLQYLEKWTQKRIEIADNYRNLLNSKSIILPKKESNKKSVYHLFVIRVDNRDAVFDMMKENGVGVAIQYPTPLPLLDAYNKFNYSSQVFPVASKLTNEIISLPIYPELDSVQQEYITNNLLKIISKR